MEIKIDNKVPFCFAPWVGLHARATQKIDEPKKLRYAPCCAWQSDFVDDIQFTDIKEKMLRQDISIIKSCKECIDEERVSQWSERLNYKRKVNEKNYFTLDKINWLDVRPSNLCNLKCIICTAHNSSMIAKEENIQYHDASLDDLKKLDLSDVKQLKILGGEPTIQASALSFIDYMCDTYDVSNMQLHITSNGTNINESLINKCLPFNESIYTISIDGTGKVFEYIRKNADWESVRQNILFLKDMTTKHKNIVLDLQSTIGAIAFVTVNKWLEEFIGLDVPSRFFLAQGKRNSMAAVPLKYKKKVRSYLKTINHEYANIIYKMSDAIKYDKNSYEAFYNHVLSKDKIRNTNILDLHPYFKEFLK